MLTAIFIILYIAFFTWFATKQFKPALGIFIVLLPTYLVRLSIGPLPSTLLELTFAALALGWLIRYRLQGFRNLQSSIFNHKFLYFCISVFLIASVTGILVSDQWYISLGQWRAYFLEPMILFLILVATPPFQGGDRGGLPSDSAAESMGTATSPSLSLERRGGEEIDPVCIINPLIVSTVSISVFGIIQRFTGWHIGNADTVALETGRITSLFLSPNAIGLYVAPIIPLFVYGLSKRDNFYTRYAIIGVLALITILLSQSLGSFVALAVGAVVFLFLLGYKKASIALVVIGILGSSLIFNLQSSKIRSMGNRLTLWRYTETFLTASPKNFVLGAGIRQYFRKVQKPYYTVGGELERLIYPHNIFLNFWSEIGLVGMLSFTFIIYHLSFIISKIYKKEKILSAALAASVTIFMVHGLVDVPYFKNDLAFLFWILASLALVSSEYRSPVILSPSADGGTKNLSDQT